MPRIRFETLSARPEGYYEAVLPRPRFAPAGHTPMMLVLEWLTLNCEADWSTRARPKDIVVRFAAAADRARAAARFLDNPDVVTNLGGPEARRSRRPAPTRRSRRAA